MTGTGHESALCRVHLPALTNTLIPTQMHGASNDLTAGKPLTDTQQQAQDQQQAPLCCGWLVATEPQKRENGAFPRHDWSMAEISKIPSQAGGAK